jgi:hypothetical protein
MTPITFAKDLSAYRAAGGAVLETINDAEPFDFGETGTFTASSGAGQPLTADEILAELDKRRINVCNPPPKPVPIFRLAGQGICTEGNLTVVAAQPKAGKSAVTGAALAAAMIAEQGTEPAALHDTLGFESAPPEGKAVVLFDTEQSAFDSWRLVQRACLRSGIERPPENFRAYRLLDVSIEMRMKMLRLELDRAAQACGGIHSGLIDGVGDLCKNLNDPEIAFALVDELIRLAVLYKCPLWLNLHENPSRESGGKTKTRGHLGSQLARKAESNLRIEKAGDICRLYAEECRSCCIPKSAGVLFKYDAESGLHVTIDPDEAADQRADDERQRARPAVAEVWGGETLLRHKELLARIKAGCRLEQRAANSRIKKWAALGLIRKTDAGDYVRN